MAFSIVFFFSDNRIKKLFLKCKILAIVIVDSKTILV